MSKTELREYTIDDIPALAQLWQRVFGDGPGFVSAFFGKLPEMGLGIVAERDGLICGASYAITGLSLARTDGRRQPLSYIYGVGVDERYRGCGIGEALVKETVSLSKMRGAEFVCCLPATESLYGWYEKTAGMRCCLYRSEMRLEAAAGPGCREIGAEEYRLRREGLLQGKNRLVPGKAASAFLEAMLREYGGGLYEVADGIGAVYLDGDCAIIRELLLPSGADAGLAASGLAAALGAKTARLFEASLEGGKYLVSDSPIQADTVWDLSFD